ncbi:hypothetical protein [Nocardia sp. CC201C]|uniref:hypothetical protein n=1 Tax=Nocardia sp. CC201C TaxID=3044575 RepID=UPI0024A89C40|nr:hypothetical protein [Nocardia sp. CC201C]
MSDITVYDKATITNMYNELHRLYGQLSQAGVDDMQAASEKLRMAWSDDKGNINAAYTSGYEPVKNAWDAEFADTLSVLNNIAVALETAMGNAFGADARIADGFGAI